MGVSYTVISISDLQLDETRDWFAKFGIIIPPSSEICRNPTPNEIRQVLSSFKEYTLDYLVGAQTFHVTIDSKATSAWAALVILDDRNTPNEDNLPHHFYFERGSFDVIIPTLERLAELCGPFIVIENGVHPRLVLPPANIDQ